MKYMGSKARHAKELLPIILKDRQEGQWYIEPFVGGANLIDKVDGNRIGSDKNFFLIELLKAIRDGWVPPSTVSEDDYAKAKFSDDAKYKAFVGFCTSYSGKWFGGYARGNDANGNPRNYADEQKRHLLKQSKGLQGIDLRCVEFDNLLIPDESIIYCDPPYAGTTKYATGGFNHDKFWQWCRDKVKEGHKVFVSEYNSPDDFISIWEKKVNNTLTKDTGSKQGVEKLFVHRSQL